MFAGTAAIDITPNRSVRMDGMIREHPSEGVHDPIFVRALALAERADPGAAFVVVSVDLCGLSEEDHAAIRRGAAQLGVAEDRVIVAATHTHSGPAAYGHFCDPEEDYAREVVAAVVEAISQSVHGMATAAVGCGIGEERTISHYRRLMADDGHVVMNWEPFPAERIVGPLGVIDPDVSVLSVTRAGNPGETLCTVFNHAGHPNVLSGDNYLISGDYPGRAVELLIERFGGNAMFLNGAQGTMDIDGLRDRDWEGRERIGNALADAVGDVVRGIVAKTDPAIRGASAGYTIPGRVITDEEWAWAEPILAETGGAYQPLADGVGDDYIAALYKRIREQRVESISVLQCCLAVDDCAFITFPGELYTEIGMRIKSESPFRHTAIIGLANGSVGYVPTRKAILEGGYAEVTRMVDAASEEIVVEQSLALLERVYRSSGD